MELEFLCSSCTSEKSGPILSTLPQYIVGSNSVSHSLFLHTDQTQLPQFLFEHPVLHPSLLTTCWSDPKASYLSCAGVNPKQDTEHVAAQSWKEGIVTSLDCWLNSLNTANSWLSFFVACARY